MIIKARAKNATSADSTEETGKSMPIARVAIAGLVGAGLLGAGVSLFSAYNRRRNSTSL